MSNDSSPEAVPGKNRRLAKRTFEVDISPGLREHVTQAARKIREAHKAELTNGLKADRAGRLFRSVIGSNGNPGEAVEALVGEVGGLLSDAIRAGTGLLEGPVIDLTQAWMAAVMGLVAKPNFGVSSAAGPVPEEASQSQPSAACQGPGMAVDTAVPGDQAPDRPSEVMLRGIFRQFMPTLLTILRQGGDGYGLARTVIALFGRPTYNQVSGLGKDKIMRLVQAEPDLWAQVAPLEAQFNRFLDEFTDYDAWTEKQARQAQEPDSPR